MATAAKKTAVATKPKSSTALVNIEAELAARAAAQMEQESSVSTGNFISFKGGILKINDNVIKDGKIDIVIADAILENAYYKGDYDSDNPRPPVCYAFGRDAKTMAPHDNSSEKQSETCAECPWNKFETAEKGKGKACKNIRRLAVLPAVEGHRSAEDLEKAQVAYAKIPVTSVKGYANYAKGIASMFKRPTLGVVTSMEVLKDEDVQVRVQFTHVENLPATEVGAVLSHMDQIEQEIFQPYPEANEEFEQSAKGKGRVPAKKAPVKTPAKGGIRARY